MVVQQTDKLQILQITRKRRTSIYFNIHSVHSALVWREVWVALSMKIAGIPNSSWYNPQCWDLNLCWDIQTYLTQLTRGGQIGLNIKSLLEIDIGILDRDIKILSSVRQTLVICTKRQTLVYLCLWAIMAWVAFRGTYIYVWSTYLHKILKGMSPTDLLTYPLV